MGITRSHIFTQGIIFCLVFLYSNYSFALVPGDEVIVGEGRKDINVRATTSASGKLLYQVSANQKGVILKGPVDQNRHRWYLIDWNDSEKVNDAGWTAMVDGWYGPTGQTLISKLALAQELAEEFFKNRPGKLETDGKYPETLILSYKQKRENGFKSLDRSNKNMRLALEAIRKNDIVTAYREYKYAIVQLNNTKQFFNEAVEILGRTETD